MNDFRYVGATPTDLEGGRPIEPGEFTGEIDVSEKSPKNKMLLDEGRLIPAPNEQERDAAAANAAKLEAAEAAGNAPAPTPAAATTSTEPAAGAADTTAGKAGESS